MSIAARHPLVEITGPRRSARWFVFDRSRYPETLSATRVGASSTTQTFPSSARHEHARVDKMA
jgi:hypothetical protein